MPRRIVLLTLLCLLVSAGNAAQASPHTRAPGGKDLKRAESLISKLRRLEESAAAPGGFGKAAARLYPGLYASVSKLRDSDLKTDLATAVSLYESALRASREGGGASPDCTREMRDSYARLCLENRGGDAARLLVSKARLHTGWAETELDYARGERGAETLEAMSLIRAERSTDMALAGEALYVLKELAEGPNAGASAAAASGRHTLASDHHVLTSGHDALASGHDALARGQATRGQADTFSDNLDGRLSDNLDGRLEEVERILASLPHGRAHQVLRNARDAFRDGLYWQLKAIPARSLVVSANSFNAPDTLPQIGLRADDAERAAHANLRTAFKFITRAEEVLGSMNDER
ncbi:MAG: hypothetical protein QOH51_1936 [Acidobacteriota bacterium]|jgi:hypothetical protein|nr:hypothetical protein [Acidobacteriota bacterium]